MARYITVELNERERNIVTHSLEELLICFEIGKSDRKEAALKRSVDRILGKLYEAAPVMRSRAQEPQK